MGITMAAVFPPTDSKMNLLELLDSAGGQQSLKNLGGNLGLDVSTTQSLVDVVGPMLMGALQKQTTSGDSLAGHTLDDQASDLFASFSGGDGFDVDDVLDIARKFF
jgi:hypothetical protein